MCRIWCLSDLHRDVSARPWQPDTIPDADLAIVAGDTRQGLADAIVWLAETLRPHMPVAVVAGNHEFYGSTHQGELDLGRGAAERCDVALLENDTIQVAGVNVTGATTWTSYTLFGEHLRPAAMRAARAVMADHRRISWSTTPWRRFRPEEARRLHETSKAFLTSALTVVDPPEHRDRPHVVVTHHAPSRRSVPARYADDLLSAAYASDLEDLIAVGRPALWVHGHMHAPADYRIGATRVVCNPLGYDGESRNFDPSLVVDLGA